jgi:GAF domain-containing protein/HAMP domain-containing protein
MEKPIMKTSLFRLPENMAERTRNAFFVIAVYLVGAVIASIALTAQAIRVASWQSWGAALSVFLVIVTSIIAWLLVKRNRVDLGIWILIINSYLAAFFLIAAISGMGVVILAAAIFLSSMVAVTTLQSRQSVLFIAGVVVGIAALLLDFSIKTERIRIPVFQYLTYILVPIMAISVGVVILRQYRNYTLRNKMMVAFIGVTLGTATILSAYMFTNTANTLRQGLERELKQHTDGVASTISALFNEQVTALTTLSLNESFQQAAADANASYVGDANAIQAILGERDAQWQAADAADNSNDPLVQEYLSNPVSEELGDFKGSFPDHVEVFITDIYGGLVGTSDRTSDYYQADEAWWKAAYNNGQGALYISEPKYDQSTGTFGVQIALPMRHHGTGEIVGVLRTTYQTSALTPILGEVVGESGETELYIPGRPAYVFHQGQLDPADPDQLNELQALAGQGLVEMDYETESATANLSEANPKTPSVVIQTSMKDLGIDTEFNRLGWLIVFHQTQDEAYAPINTGIRGAVIVLAIVVFLAVAGAYTLSAFLVRPITQLTQTAEEVAAGKLDSRAEASSADEIGILANTFNSMTSQLQNTLQGLEQRVADRTRNLELAAEVGRTVSQVRALEVMLTDAAELIRKQFDLYYVQVYLVNPSQTYLNLRAGTGQVGTQLLAREHRLPLNAESINGRAAVEKKSVIISNTAASATFKPNPLLPDTRSEMAVPLIVGERVVGVLDMQSEHAGSLNKDILPAFEALAGQIAIAIQNANFLAEVEQARAEVEAQARRLSEKNWAEYLDAIHKPEETGFVFQQNKVLPLTHESETNDNALAAPITVTGETLGELVVEMEGEAPVVNMDELLSSIARQVSQQIENLRLIDSAERYRLEAEKAARLTTMEGWKKYVESRPENIVGYFYDSKEVKPLQKEPEDAALTLPIKVRDETVGKFAVQDVETQDEQSLNIAHAVIESLGAHIENLRLLEETQRGQIELNKRAQREQTLRQITSALRSSTNPETIMRTAVRELGSILARRTVVQMMSPEQDAQVESTGKNGNGSAPVAGSTESA